jgi:LemA protein
MTFWILLGILALLALWMMSSYNGLVAMRQRVRQSFSDVDVQLKQRHDLVPSLVETVKGYAAHERGTLDAVIAARSGAVSAQGAGAQAAAEGALSASLGRLIALSENYPELKANANFMDLQGKLQQTEDKIAAARRFYNNSAAEYNAKSESLPIVFVSRQLGFHPEEFFNLEEGERKAVHTAPQVKF